MSLHVDSYGSGAPLLLIHGWGMHGGMWGGVAERLANISACWWWICRGMDIVQ